MIKLFFISFITLFFFSTVNAQDTTEIKKIMFTIGINPGIYADNSFHASLNYKFEEIDLNLAYYLEEPQGFKLFTGIGIRNTDYITNSVTT